MDGEKPVLYSVKVDRSTLGPSRTTTTLEGIGPMKGDNKKRRVRPVPFRSAPQSVSHFYPDDGVEVGSKLLGRSFCNESVYTAQPTI